MQTITYLPMFNRLGVLRCVLCAFSALCAVRFAPCLAQEPTPTRLCVTLHDAQAAGVPGIAVIIRNADIDGEVGRARTAADGSVCIETAAIPASVRVELQGNLPNGIPLYHQRADTGGILFFPGTLGETRLDLLVAADGMLLPDPAMWALDPLPAQESPIPFDPSMPVATPARATVVWETAAPLPTIGQPTPVAATAVVENGPAPTSSGIPFALLLASGAVLLGVGIVLVFKRHHRP